MRMPAEESPVTRWIVLAEVGALLLCLTGIACAGALMPVDLTRVQSASGGFPASSDKPVGVGGRIYDGYLGFSGWATWRVPAGYTMFEAYLGVDDESGNERPVTFNVLLDGDIVKSVKLQRGQKAEKVSIPVRGGASLRLEIEGYGGVFAEPRLLAGTAAPSPGSAQVGSLTGAPSAPAAFVVDPRDLDQLADSLWRKVEANEAFRHQVTGGHVAVATFNLIDIPAQSVAQNVAEDLYTAMINSGFALVERGQLDKVLKELKIQDTGLIDPATAKRIGQLSGCNVILLGSISDRGQFVVINARLMDVSTGKSLVAARIEMRKIPITRGA